MGVVRYGKPSIANGRVTFEFTSPGLKDTISFSCPSDFHFHNDLAAACLVSIFGRRFPTAHFDFEVSTKCLSELQRLSNVKLSAKANIAPRKVGSKASLAFSGGFDSLAGYLLCPDIYSLASIDFGPLWRRERRFFETFDTTIIETDFRAKRYDRHHWMMMCAPVILYADYLHLDGIGFGTIFEATHEHLFNPEVRHKVPDDFRVAVGLRDYTLTRGLTEFATAKIINLMAPERIEASLASLANDGTEKLFRKRLLTQMVQSDKKIGIADVQSIPVPTKENVTLGSSFGLDFLYFAFSALTDIDVVSRVVQNPELLHEFRSQEIGMDWVHKYNPIFLDDLPYTKVGEILGRLSDMEIGMFNSWDFENYQRFSNFWIDVSRRPKN